MVEALLQELEGRGVIVLPHPRRGVGPGGVMMIRQRLDGESSGVGCDFMKFVLVVLMSKHLRHVQLQLFLLLQRLFESFCRTTSHNPAGHFVLESLLQCGDLYPLLQHPLGLVLLLVNL